MTKLSEHVIEAKIMIGNNARTRVLVARMTMIPSDQGCLSNSIEQFPLMLSYANDYKLKSMIDTFKY